MIVALRTTWDHKLERWPRTWVAHIHHLWVRCQLKRRLTDMTSAFNSNVHLYNTSSYTAPSVQVKLFKTGTFVPFHAHMYSAEDQSGSNSAVADPSGVCLGVVWTSEISQLKIIKHSQSALMPDIPWPPYMAHHLQSRNEQALSSITIMICQQHVWLVRPCARLRHGPHILTYDFAAVHGSNLTQKKWNRYQQS